MMLPHSGERMLPHSVFLALWADDKWQANTVASKQTNGKQVANLYRGK
jgi:hypothetical protein